jgi:hypothetical protein
MALTFPLLCSFNVKQAERRFPRWRFTFLVLERIRRMASRGKEQGEGFFQAFQKCDDAWNARSPSISTSRLWGSGHFSVLVVEPCAGYMEYPFQNRVTPMALPISFRIISIPTRWQEDFPHSLVFPRFGIDIHASSTPTLR